MSTDYVSAKDAIFSLFKTSWDANSAAIAGYVPEIFYVGIGKTLPPDSSRIWTRISMQTVAEPLATFAANVGGPDKRRYTSQGLVFVQMFCPKIHQTAQRTGELLAVLARNTFRAKTADGEVILRNSRIQELSPENEYLRFNVVAEFEFDEIR